MKVTASAAAALILDPAARAVQESAPEAYEEAQAEVQGQSQDGPVGRAKERWKEARNEMPEVILAIQNLSILNSGQWMNQIDRIWISYILEPRLKNVKFMTS